MFAIILCIKTVCILCVCQSRPVWISGVGVRLSLMHKNYHLFPTDLSLHRHLHHLHSTAYKTSIKMWSMKSSPSFTQLTYFPVFSRNTSASIKVWTLEEQSSVSDSKWVSPFCRVHRWASRPPRSWHTQEEDERGKECVCGGEGRCIDVLYPNDKSTGLMARHN